MMSLRISCPKKRFAFMKKMTHCLNLCMGDFFYLQWYVISAFSLAPQILNAFSFQIFLNV